MCYYVDSPEWTPGEIDEKNEGIHFTDKQKCEDTEFNDGLKVSKTTGPDLLSYTYTVRQKNPTSMWGIGGISLVF